MIQTERERDIVLGRVRRYPRRLRELGVPLSAGERTELANGLEELIEFARGIQVLPAGGIRPGARHGS